MDCLKIFCLPTPVVNQIEFFGVKLRMLYMKEKGAKEFCGPSDFVRINEKPYS